MATAVLSASEDPSPKVETRKRSKSMVEVEALLDPANERLALFPIVDEDAWALYEKQRGSFWLPGDINFLDDIRHWDTMLTKDEQSFIKTVLQFFAVGDGLVTKNIDENFGTEVTVNEYKVCYTFQSMMENIHNETYSIFIQTLIKDPEEAKNMLNAVETHPFVREKMAWAHRYMDKDIPFCDRIVAFACMEGIFFSASFCAIFWLKHRGLMPGFSQANELINRDENAHTEFACLIHKKLVNKSVNVRNIVASAVELECKFVDSALKVDLIGMKAEEMKTHVKFVADILLGALGEEPMFNVDSPFDWMRLIITPSFGNFFERKIAAYPRAELAPLEKGGFDLDDSLI